MVPKLLAELRGAGVCVTVTADGLLKVEGAITDRQRADLREFKDLIVRVLRLNENTTSGHSLGASFAFIRSCPKCDGEGCDYCGEFKLPDGTELP